MKAPAESNRRGSTRAALVEAVRQQLKTRRPSEIRIADLTQAVGTSQPNFYNHFANLQEALLACAVESWRAYPDLTPWLGPDIDLDAARQIVSALIAYWQEYSQTLEWAYLTSIGGGSADYIRAKEAGEAGALRAIAKVVRISQGAGRLDAGLDPSLCAAIILERLNNWGMGYAMTIESGYTREQILDNAARMLRADLLGH